MSAVAIIAEACIGTKDRACVESCPVQCIYEYQPETNTLFSEDVPGSGEIENTHTPNPGAIGIFGDTTLGARCIVALIEPSGRCRTAAISGRLMSSQYRGTTTARCLAGKRCTRAHISSISGRARGLRRGRGWALGDATTAGPHSRSG